MPEFKKKIFYGEYTLLHWVELILTKNIILPEYQRSFVWEKEQVEEFLKKLKNGVFVPPVIIGSLNKCGVHENIILDGQQRLTSILLGYLGRYPRKDAFKKSYNPLYTLDIPEDDEPEDEITISWSFRLLTGEPNYTTKEKILDGISFEQYEELSSDVKLDDEVMNTTYLGLSYIVPETSEENLNQRFYSIVFHDINQQGVVLQGQESRRSLYYLNADLVPFFEPNELHDLLKISHSGTTMRYDYVRALAFLAQYVKNTNEHQIAKRCKNQELFELYFEKYIYSVVNDEDSDMFGRFSSSVGINNISVRNQRLREWVEKLGYTVGFSSIVDADIKLFGLIYCVVFMNKQLQEDKIPELLFELENKKAENNDNTRYRSSGLMNIRKRIKDSIETYSSYIV